MRGFSLFDLLLALVLLLGAVIYPLSPAGPSATSEIAQSAEEPIQLATAMPSTALALRSQQDAAATKRAGRAIYTRHDADLQRAELWTVGLDGSGDQLLVSCAGKCQITDLALAPDHTQVAYIAQTAGQPGELRLINRNGSGERLFARDVAQLGAHAFSADSTQLAFVRYRYEQGKPVSGSIWTLATSGGEPRQVTPWFALISPPAWLPDGRLIFSAAVAEGAQAAVYLVPRRAKAAPVEMYRGWLLDLAPDRSKALVLSTIRTDGGDQGRFDHHVIQLDGAEPQLLAQWQWPLGRTSWSPDGTRIALVSNEAKSLFVADLAGGTQRLVKKFAAESNVSGPAVWAPGGESLLYALDGAASDGIAQIRQLQLNDKQEEPLTIFAGREPVLVVVTSA